MKNNKKLSHEQLKRALRLYAVSDNSCLRNRTLMQCVEEIISGGVSIVQYRNKEMGKNCTRGSNRENSSSSHGANNFYKEACALKEICNAHNVPLIINDNIELAKELGAAGVHVGQDDMPCKDVRSCLGENFIIGVSVQTKAQAVAAQLAGADYLGVGAMIPTPTKPDAVVVSIEELRDIVLAVDIPVVAIGGINASNVKMFKGCGIAGVAVVSALFGAENPAGVAKELSTQISKIL